MKMMVSQILSLVACVLAVGLGSMVKYDGYQVYRITPLTHEHLAVLRELENERVRGCVSGCMRESFFNMKYVVWAGILLAWTVW